MNSTSGLTVAMVLCRRELIRFTRQPMRIAAAIGTPALLWIFMASGFAHSIRPEQLGDINYPAFLLPGVMTLVAVFAAIFSSISIIEDRRDGWLQSVLVSPGPRWAIALGKIVGGALVAWIQAAVLILTIPLLGIEVPLANILLTLFALGLTCFAMTALGIAFAWRSETTAGFHAVMNLLFLPMWMLSGAFFPAQGTAGWMSILMQVNPLTWCTQSIRNPILDQGAAFPIMLSILFAGAMMAIATFIIARPNHNAT